MLPCFGDSITGWSSRMSQSRAHTEIFRDSLAGQCPSRKKYLECFSKFGFSQLSLVTCSRVEGPVASGLRDFCGLPRDSFTGKTFSRKKHLDKVFKIFVLSVLVTCLQLDSVAKIACFAQIGQFLNFFSFPSNYCDYSLSSSFHPSPKHTVHSTQTSIVDHLSNLILQEKGMGSYFLTLFYMFMSVFLRFVGFFWVCVFCYDSNMGLLKMLDLVVWGWLFLLLDYWICLLSWFSFFELVSNLTFVVWNISYP